jgi:4-amino-4-deoxy-L-arabinose transferase-like glycosyltransferase
VTGRESERSNVDRGTRRALVLIATGALLLRAAVVMASADAGLFADMRDYQARALHLLRRGVFYPDAFWPPVYPVFLALTYAVGGIDLLVVRLVQAGLGAASVVLTFALARSLTPSRGALAAAAIVAIYPALVLLPVLILSENLFVALVLAGLCLAQRRERYAFLPAGVALGLATLTRSVGWAAIVGVAVSLVTARQERRRLTRDLAQLAAGCALVMGPWAVRNAALYERPVLVLDTASGYNFLLGNNPRATGRLELEDVPRVTDTYWREARTDLERSDAGYEAGTAFIVENPGRSAGLAIRKVQFLLGLEGREWAWLYSERYFGPRARATVRFWGLALVASFPALALAALGGLSTLGLVRDRAGVAIVSTLVAVLLLHALSFGESRYHVPWVPLLAILAARGLAPPAPRPMGRRRIAVVTLVAVLLALTWLDQLPLLLARLDVLAARAPDPPRLSY